MDHLLSGRDNFAFACEHKYLPVVYRVRAIEDDRFRSLMTDFA